VPRTRRLLVWFVAFAAILSEAALGQQVGPSSGGAVGPSGGVGPNQAPVGRGAHDLVQRGVPSQVRSPSTAQLSKDQCRNFLSSWSSLTDQMKTEMQETKHICDQVVE
jgi:hypothetical protein